MFLWFIEQLAFHGALCAVVLGLLWPHVRPLVPMIWRKLSQPLSVILNITHLDRDSSNIRASSSRDHPKFSGRKLKRLTSERSIRSTYRSSAGFGQSSSLVDDFSVERDSHSPSGQPGLPLHAGPAVGSSIPSYNSNQSSMFLTLFSASIIALVVYTLIKMLNARFGGQITTNCEAAGSSRGPSFRASGTQDMRGDRKRLTRLKREERVRQLVLRHGGRNVSNAIKFLVAELERQKQLLHENLLSENLTSCTCATNSAMTDYIHTDSTVD